MGSLFGKKEKGPKGPQGAAAYKAALAEREAKAGLVTPTSRDYKLGYKEPKPAKEAK